MGLEATSWDWLRTGIKKTVPEFSLLERVENGVLAGMADVNYLIRGTEGWIELKATEMPTRESTPILGREGLNREQINWHLARQRLSGRTWVFVSAAPYRWLISGVYADQMNEWTRDEMCLWARVWYDESWGATQWMRLIRALAG